MGHKDWEQVEELFHAAVSLPPEERAVYLARACSEDASLRTEVESLIAAFENRRDLMETPTFSLGLKLLAEDSPEESLIGSLIGVYRILALLGSGGMGDVYLAEDSRLDRKVALKFLSNRFVNDAWAKRQLVKEAQAVAKLDHPNICTVYGYEEANGYNFIVMHYCEGETLASLIRDKLLNPNQILGLSIKIVSAIAEAHSHGIIHRDIKPQNIIVTTSGQVKVLDFGLAKLVQQRQTISEGVSDNQSSQVGLVIGTVAYMSPEQLRAERVDFRSDIFSLGVVLYEMISGTNPYSRASNAEIISAILTTDPPPLKSSPSGVSARVAQAAQKCLRRDREQRYQSASELLLDLDNIEERQVTASRRQPYFSRRMLIGIVLILLIVAAALFEYLQLTHVPTLAILPIVYETSDPDREHLGEGITDGLVRKLSRLSGLRVKAPAVVPDSERGDLGKIGRSLGVDRVLAATISERNTTSVLEIALVDGKRGSPTWTDEYELKPEQVLSVAETISTKVASMLHVALSDEEKRLLMNRQTDSADAFRECFRGRHCWNRRTAQDIKKAIAHFNSAIELDPAYAEAYSGLADCYVLMGIAGYGGLSTSEAMRLARAAGERAVALDDTIGEAHTSLAIGRMLDSWNWEDAEREFKIAISLKPNYAPAHYWYTTLLALRGHYSESIASSERASELEPFSSQYDVNVGRAFYYARQYDKAALYTARAIEKAPNGQTALYMAGLVCIQRGQMAEAIQLLEKVYASNKSFAGAPLGYSYARSGRRADALKVLEEMSKDAALPTQEKAIVFLGLDDRERTFQMLQQSCKDHHATFPFVFIEPLFDGLRSEPRFAELAQCARMTF